MSKHTTGPWLDDGDGWIATATGHIVVGYAGCGSHEAAWANEADFLLAKAAPDLLEALRTVQMLRSLGGLMPGSREIVMLAVEAADEAIAKATGAPK